MIDIIIQATKEYFILASPILGGFSILAYLFLLAYFECKFKKVKTHIYNIFCVSLFWSFTWTLAKGILPTSIIFGSAFVVLAALHKPLVLGWEND